MRTGWMAAWAALATLGLGAPPVSADPVDDEVREMQQRLEQLEASLEAASQELEVSNQQAAEQRALIERSGLGSGASSGMAGFLDTLEMGGWVNASYWYNTNDVDNDDLTAAPNTGAFGAHNFFNPDSNTFSFEQLWFELERPVNESQRGGFRADLLLGNDADQLDDFFLGSHGGQSGDEEDFYVHQAYVQYLADFGNGVHFKAGKFATLIGYEVVQSPYNDQISRGIVWENLQPIDHVGLLISTQRQGWEAAVGLVNSAVGDDQDNNDFKTVTGRVGYTGENYSVMLNGLWGSEETAVETDRTGLADLIVTLEPTDQLSLWANANFLRISPSLNTAPNRGDDLHAWGAAVGGRLAVTERTGFSVRGEYLQDDGALITGIVGPGNAVQDVTLWSVTGTVDHKLTDNLIVRGEVRWDKGRIDEAEDNFFVDDSGPSLNFDDDDQILVGVDITYLFN